MPLEYVSFREVQHIVCSTSKVDCRFDIPHYVARINFAFEPLINVKVFGPKFYFHGLTHLCQKHLTYRVWGALEELANKLMWTDRCTHY